MRQLLLALAGLFSLTLSAQEVVTFEQVGSISKQSLTDTYGFLIQNGVDMYKVTYTTPDVFGVQDTASGLLVLPDDYTKAYPSLIYHHGTIDNKQDVPSNLAGGFQLATVFGGVGYVTLAPDFLGLGESRGFQLYVHADTEASASVDMYRALLNYGGTNADFFINEQLFLTGYSQGGHASMASQRLINQQYADEIEVTAAAHMSGPYSISEAMIESTLGDEPFFFGAYLANVILSYQIAYGNIYDSLEEIFQPQYVPLVEQYRDGEIGLFVLNDSINTRLLAETGTVVPNNILQDSIVQIARTLPDGHPIAEALRDNDVYDFVPEAPTRLYYCMADDQVTFRNAIIADSAMNAAGAANVQAFDVNSNADHGGCVNPATTSTVIFFGQYRTVSTGTEAPVDLTGIGIRPNPASETAELFVPAGAPVRARLYDATGRLLDDRRYAPGTHTIDVSALGSGLYFAQYTREGISRTVKLVVR